MNNIEQVDREAIERDGFATTGGSIGITKRSATAETKRWLENMTAEQREHHRKREAELNKNYEEQKYY